MDDRAHRIFLLSPAHCGGRRARLVFEDSARFEIARRLRKPDGAPLGEVFSFLSGLYFRAKLAYARAFAHPPAGMPGALVITPGDGLRRADERITLRRLRRFAGVRIDPSEYRYRRPLERDGRGLAAEAGPDCQIILLGSIATGKYADVLEGVFGDRLRFPAEFVGRGDMSRGGLMLRCVDSLQPLSYIPVEGAIRRGPRPPKLLPRMSMNEPAPGVLRRGMASTKKGVGG